MTGGTDHHAGATEVGTVRGARLRTFAGAAAVLAVIGLGCFSAWYRAVYYAWPGENAGDRVHWCGRDYEYQGPPLTTRQAKNTSWPLHAEGAYPPLALSGDELFAATYPARLRTSTSCATLVFLRTGPDAYKLYSLEGGP